MKTSVEEVKAAADDQHMLVGIVLSKISDNQARTDSVAELTEEGAKDANRMIETAFSLNQTTKKFMV